MRTIDEKFTKLSDKLLYELDKLLLFYHSLIFCGIIISVLFFWSAFAFLNAMWIQVGMVWLSLSLITVSAYIYFKAYKQVRRERDFYILLLQPERKKKKLPGSQYLQNLMRTCGNPHLLSFITGLLLCLAVFAHFLDQYEDSFFRSLSRQVAGNQKAISEDSVLIRSVTTCHDLLAARSVIFANRSEPSWIDRFIHPVNTDLVAADGACGSYAVVLCRMLQGLNFKVRLAQMQCGEAKACHIVVEARTSHGWVVLDPLYALYFVRPDNRLASFADVSGNWPYYVRQTPQGYKSPYCYEGVRYTNWKKIPVIMPLFKTLLNLFMDQQSLEQISLRPYFLRKYRILEYLVTLPLLLAITGLFLKLTRKSRSPKSHKSPQSITYSIFSLKGY